MSLPVLPASRSIALTLLQSTTTTVFLTTDVIDGECYGYAIFVDDWHLRAFVIWYVTSFSSDVIGLHDHHGGSSCYVHTTRN